MPQAFPFPLTLPVEPSPILLDESLWPLVVVKLGRSCSSQELETYLETRSSYLERRQRHLCIIDARELHMPPHSLRQRHTDWLRDNEPALRQWTLGTAYLITSPVVRVMMSAMRHCAALTTPFVVTTTLPPAAAWAAERLQDAGLAQAASRVRAHYAVAAS